jgi:PAS domain S-box-containing protein
MDAVRSAKDPCEDRTPAAPFEQRPAVKRSPRSGAKATRPKHAAARSPSESPAVCDEVLRVALDRSPSGMTVSAPDGRWLWTNDAYCRMLGYERGELLGISHADVTHGDDVAGDREFTAAVFAGERESLEREKRYIRKDGSVMWAWVLLQAVCDDQGAPLYFVSHVQDVSDRHKAEDRLRDSERTLRSVIDNTPAMICVTGRDHRYKLVNREFELMYAMSSDWIIGHPDADLLPPSTLADVHARELAVLETGQSSQEETTTVRDGQEQILLVTRFPLLDEHGVIHGVCTASTDITERRVEEGSKRDRLQCSELIYSALAEGRFVLHGQPIVQLGSMHPVRAELLIRMRATRDNAKLIAPGVFLPAAERFGLITTVDEWVVDRAIEFAAAGHRITVNVSAQTVSAEDQVDRIERAVIASGGPADNLVFEITETAVADNLDAARTFATRMRRLGCAIALDDFGVGHGAFTYLRHLPVDYLKIDLQFVRDVIRDEGDRQVVAAIVGVARQFGIETIAEGVEDQDTLELLRRMGVDYAQGYLIGRPMALTRCWSFLGDDRQEAAHVRSD